VPLRCIDHGEKKEIKKKKKIFSNVIFDVASFNKIWHGPTHRSDPTDPRSNFYITGIE
jgi:hypothetical protein